MYNDATPSYTAAEIDALLDYVSAPDGDGSERVSALSSDDLSPDVEFELRVFEMDLCAEISDCGRSPRRLRDLQAQMHKLEAARRMGRLPPSLLPELRRAAAAVAEIKREPVAALLARIAREAAQAAASATAAAQTAAATATQPAPADPQSAALGLAALTLTPRLIAQRPFSARVRAGLLLH